MVDNFNSDAFRSFFIYFFRINGLGVAGGSLRGASDSVNGTLPVDLGYCDSLRELVNDGLGEETTRRDLLVKGRVCYLDGGLITGAGGKKNSEE